MINYEVKDYGFTPPAEITKEEYVLGDHHVPEIELRPDGQWDDALPVEELQLLHGLETSNCTAFGTLNCIESLYIAKFGREKNYSDRWVGIKAGTWPPGNDPHKVPEAIRKNGLVEEKLLPFSPDINTLEKYYSAGSKLGALTRRAKLWLELFDFRHEWVFRPGVSMAEKHLRLISALRFSPVGASVVAWRHDGKYFYKLPGERDGHWIQVYGYVSGEYWKVYDSYDQTHKKLAWNYDFGFAKRYWLDAKVDDPEYYEQNNISPKTNWLISLWQAIINLFKRP